MQLFQLEKVCGTPSTVCDRDSRRQLMIAGILVGVRTSEAMKRTLKWGDGFGGEEAQAREGKGLGGMRTRLGSGMLCLI